MQIRNSCFKVRKLVNLKIKLILVHRRAGGGSIINTASFVAILGAATPQIAYTASKGAVLCTMNLQ